ncbi:TadE/TadG family type IV pilus assembly protein [Amycolatopsis sp. WGS_07]|uniref:TadE/TadG family type IV pilus assembly protein n=1 Tax=Amycolatopsis sp. WGS_07 TaxID=3076764 RepID=UPI003872CA16
MNRGSRAFLAGERPRDEGSVSIETAALMIAVIAVGLLIVVGARVSSAQQIVDDAATAAARAASLSRGTVAATRAGGDAARARLTQSGLVCNDVSVSVDASEIALGRAGLVRARVTCRVRLSDLALPSPVGDRTITSTFTSPVDPYRGVR